MDVIMKADGRTEVKYSLVFFSTACSFKRRGGYNEKE